MGSEQRGFNPKEEQAKKPGAKFDTNKAAEKDDVPSLEELVKRGKADLARKAEDKSTSLEELRKAADLREMRMAMDKKKLAEAEEMIRKLSDAEAKDIKARGDEGLE